MPFALNLCYFFSKVYSLFNVFQPNIQIAQ
jgi:hypothetical protein